MPAPTPTPLFFGKIKVKVLLPFPGFTGKKGPKKVSPSIFKRGLHPSLSEYTYITLFVVLSRRKKRLHIGGILSVTLITKLVLKISR